MKNGCFQLVKYTGGYGIKLIPPLNGGQDIILNEVMEYLTKSNIPCDHSELIRAVKQKQETVIFLGPGECPKVNEFYSLTVSQDSMKAVVRFFPPSQAGSRMDMEEFLRDLNYKKIVIGIQKQLLQKHFQEGCYCTDIVAAIGKEPIMGKDAYIEYYFNTDVQVRPAMREDGSVDFFNLNTVNHCKNGDILARVIPEVPGEPGANIFGNPIKTNSVKKAILRYNKNVAISEDKKILTSLKDGHVVLVDDKVFVSNILEVENVDNSTGNIEFEGSVQVNGNVQSNFKISARGNVIVSGVVEGAYVEAGGDIIIKRGMNGMAKGYLKAGGNIVAKYLENVKAEAEGYISAGSILHSKIISGSEIEVTGKRGFITGGHVCAAEKITVKTLGSSMGASTVVEVIGANPNIKQKYQDNQKKMNEIVKIIKNAQPIIQNFIDKKTKGANVSEAQMKYIKDLIKLIEQKKQELIIMRKENEELKNTLNNQSKATVVVKDTVYPGTTIVIGDISMVVQKNYHYCKFEKVLGAVKMVPIN